MNARNPLRTLLLALLGIAPIPHAVAADAVVSGGSCNTAGFYNALDAVQGSGGGTITFSCAAPLTVTFTVYRPISTAVVIDGADAVTFDGANTSPFFQVFNGQSLVLRRLVVRRGAFTGGHYALENFGTLTLDRVGLREHVSTASAIVNSGELLVASSTFSDNGFAPVGSTADGAVLRNEGGDATIEDSLFEDNGTDEILARGGAIHHSAGNVELRRVVFRGNAGFDGGAIFVDAGASLVVSGSTFDTNEAGYGGAIEARGNVRVSGSRFESNSATGDGGAVWIFTDGFLQVRTSVFEDNSAGTLGGAISTLDSTGEAEVGFTSFIGNTSDQHGGAIYSNGRLLVGNATFTQNQAATGFGGGAIYQTGNSVNALATLDFLTVVANTAGYGAGIANFSSGGTGSSLQISRSIISGNSTGPSDSGNCAGDSMTSIGYNISDDTYCGGVFGGTDAMNATLPFLPLADNGGPTPTLKPGAGSDAIDFVPNANCVDAIDQRGAPRPAGAACDAGAMEVDATPAPFDRIFGDGFE